MKVWKSVAGMNKISDENAVIIEIIGYFVFLGLILDTKYHPTILHALIAYGYGFGLLHFHLLLLDSRKKMN